MRSLVLGDIHFNKNFNLFKEAFLPFIKQIVERYKYDKVVILGDVFDTSTLDNISLSLFKQLILLLGDVPIDIIVGNHDKVTKTINAFDLLLLSSNITIYNGLKIEGQYIYLPHMHKTMNVDDIFKTINEHIANSDYDEFYIYSHNDFSEIYTFRNSFTSISDRITSDADIFLINGHNHVPIFKKNSALTILNIGSAINLSYKDRGTYNYFLILDDALPTVDERFEFIYNKYTIQYYKFDIASEDDIHTTLSGLNTDNIKYVTFKSSNPNIVIDNHIKTSLCAKYNIIEVLIDYDISIDNYNTDNLNDTLTDSTELTDLLATFDISYDEFLQKNTVEDLEKLEILFILLELFFTDYDTADQDQEQMKHIVNKYFLNIDE